METIGKIFAIAYNCVRGVITAEEALSMIRTLL